MELTKLGLSDGGHIGVTSFVASSHPADSCGLNGLPLTPNSVTILGNGQILKTVNHPNLCEYLDIVRGKCQRIALVSEFWQTSMKTLLHIDSKDTILSISCQVLKALVYLNEMGINNLNLSPENIMFDSTGTVKLFGYGLGLITEYGKLVSFPVGDPRYTAPEVLIRGMQTVKSEKDAEGLNDCSLDLPMSIPDQACPPDQPQVDVWSLGMIILGQLLNINYFWHKLKVGQVLKKIVRLGECDSGSSVMEKIAREHTCLEKLYSIDKDVLKFLEACLEPRSSKRPTPLEMLEFKWFQMLGKESKRSLHSFPVIDLRSRYLESPEIFSFKQSLDFLSIREVYYLWQLAGGDVMTELKKHGLMITTPPIISMPTIVTGEGQEFGVPRQRAALLDKTIITLPLLQLKQCIAKLSRNDLMPTIDDIKAAEPNQLPLIIREKDVRFQCRRVITYRRLLQGYPFRKYLVEEESRRDIVPLYRAQIWSALLGIDYDTVSVYSSIDKESPNSVDRQIEVDIPRCHQYSELLASQEGHRKLKRVLKAWVVTNPHLVYWQGLDSLAAPFLLLNFNNESVAWACLTAFIPKYLNCMFQKDNASVIQEYLAKFSHLQAFYDPVLFNHLDEIGFIPDLYAIPWVLTMFSHVFPLHKIFHLWDTLLLGNSSYPLCVGLAILLQLRAQLIESQFNECILLFSEMPAVDIDSVVTQSKLIFDRTPWSLMYRVHDQTKPQTADKDINLNYPSVPVSVLKSEKVGRICGKELIDLIDLRKLKYSKSEVFIIDVRNKEEFRSGCLPGASNIPAEHFLEFARVPNDQDLENAKTNGKIIAIVGKDKDPSVHRVAELLLVNQYARVVTLHGGMQVFKNADILMFPSPK